MDHSQQSSDCGTRAPRRRLPGTREPMRSEGQSTHVRDDLAQWFSVLASQRNDPELFFFLIFFPQRAFKIQMPGYHPGWGSLGRGEGGPGTCISLMHPGDADDSNFLHYRRGNRGLGQSCLAKGDKGSREPRGNRNQLI